MRPNAKRLDAVLDAMPGGVRTKLPCTITGLKTSEKPFSHSTTEGRTVIVERKVYTIGLRLPDGTVVQLDLKSADIHALREVLCEEPHLLALEAEYQKVLGTKK